MVKEIMNLSLALHVTSAVLSTIPGTNSQSLQISRLAIFTLACHIMAIG